MVYQINDIVRILPNVYSDVGGCEEIVGHLGQVISYAGMGKYPYDILILDGSSAGNVELLKENEIELEKVFSIEDCF